MFGKLNDLASSAAQSLGNNEQKPEGENKAAPSEQKWNDLGGNLKKTVGEVQESRAKGENVDFAKLGGVAKQAAETYNSQENKNDLQGIGKNLATGFFGSAQKAEVSKPEGEDKPQEEQQAPEPTPQQP